jgi:hypothetical protein
MVTTTDKTLASVETGPPARVIHYSKTPRPTEVGDWAIIIVSIAEQLHMVVRVICTQMNRVISA